MTEQTQPTDAELIAELESAGVQFMAFRGGISGTKDVWTTSGSQHAKQIAAGMRAAIAKWGTPAGAGEPQPSSEGPPEVWLQLHCDCLPHERTEPVDYTGGDVTWCWHAIHSDDVRYVRADLATTQQPTQAQAGAVPLTDEWIRSRCKEPWIFETAKQWIRIAEAAHGIKGADHG